MHQTRTTGVTHILSPLPSRRDVLRSLAAAGLGLAVLRPPSDGTARKRKRKNTKRPKPNEFGCLNVGAACKNADQCCSGICQGKKGKRKCLAHNAGICQPENDYCLGSFRVCEASGEDLSVCWLTTGKAAFCANLGGVGISEFCRNCARDTDCQAEFGPGAACIDVRAGICADLEACIETGGTACVAAVA